MDNLYELLSDRRLSRLYVEIYQRPTGFHSSEAMQKDIFEKNKKIAELLNDNPDAKNILKEDQRKFEMSALGYLCAKQPLIKKYLDQETKNHLRKVYGLDFT